METLSLRFLLGKTVLILSEPARGFSVLATDGDQSPPVNFQAGMQQPGILQPAEPDSLSIGHRRFTESAAAGCSFA
jgi:hypothetical protein